MGETISIGIFKEKSGWTPLNGKKPANLVFTLSGKSLRTTAHHIHTYADPFLFEESGELYLFAEIQATGEVGYLNCWQYNHDANWLDKGPVIKGSTHFSYPFIMKDKNGRIYMIPESSEQKQISLWEFENFPFNVKKVKTLLVGAYVDSSIIYSEGKYFLITTNSAGELLIFFSDELLSENWIPHPSNPITGNKQISRNGGGIVLLGGKLIRIAQNCRNKYGEGIIILSVEKLDQVNYEEKIVIDDYRPKHNYKWQILGRHHLSVCNYESKTFIAMDGYAEDLIVNKLISGLFKLLRK